MLEKMAMGKKKDSNRLSPIFCIGKQHKMLIFNKIFLPYILFY